jgi:hypothetical protein
MVPGTGVAAREPENMRGTTKITIKIKNTSAAIFHIQPSRKASGSKSSNPSLSRIPTFNIVERLPIVHRPSKISDN